MIRPLYILAAILPLGHALSQQVALQSPVFEQEPEEPWTVFNKTIKRVAVIGAGLSGLQSAAALAEHNFTVRLFERAPGPGGNWLYSNEVPVRESYPDAPLGQPQAIPDKLPFTQYYHDGDEGISLDERWREHWQPRPIWDSLHTNSPAVITEVPGVPYPPDHSWVIDAHTIGAHVRAYATIHKLNANDDSPIPSYATRVERLTKSNVTNTWQLTLRHLKRLDESGRIKATWWTEEFDAVVVASGPYDTPHVPKIEGLIEWSKIKAKDTPTGYPIYHSRTYRTPQRYAGKTVLVVGPGTSGSEIARDIAPYANKVLASTKEYDWPKLHPFQRRSFRRFPSETEFIPEIASFQPLAADSEGISSGKIVLINGTVLTGVDEIILATGYKRSNPFLQQILNDTLGNNPNDRDTNPLPDIFGGRPLRNVHWTGLYIPDPTLAFTSVRPWTAGQYQSYGFSKIWGGTARIPNEAELWNQYNSTRFTFGGLFGTYRSEALVRQWVTWLNNESLEHGGRLVAPWPVKNWEIFAYYANIEWEKDYIHQDNFTRFENLPAEDWNEAKLWDISVQEDVYW